MQLIHAERDLELPGTDLDAPEIPEVSVNVAPQSVSLAGSKVEEIRYLVADLPFDLEFQVLRDVAGDADAELPQIGDLALIRRNLGVERSEILLEPEGKINTQPFAGAQGGVRFHREPQF